MPVQRLSSSRSARLGAIVLPLLVCAAAMGADSAPGSTINSGSAVFAAATTVEVTSAAVVEIKKPTWATVRGTVSGEPAEGSVYWGPGTYEMGAGTALSFDKGAPIPTMFEDAANPLGIVGIIATILLFILIIVRRDIRPVQPTGPFTWRLAGAAARLLPPGARDEHLEEWTAWLRDMQVSRVPWHRYLGEVASIALVAAPRLALTLRRRPREPEDR